MVSTRKKPLNQLDGMADDFITGIGDPSYWNAIEVGVCNEKNVSGSMNQLTIENGFQIEM